MPDTTTTELLTRPAGELAALVRAREVTPRELAEASLARIEALDGRVNAFTHVDPEVALAEADAVEPGDARPFAGVPIAIKDLRATRGYRVTHGSSLLGDFRPGYDVNVVRRLRAAGFVVVGIANMPEFGILPVTEPRRYGPTRNPWDLDRTPGGSSGGSAAAVAAGMVPLAGASDGGGSTRIPAACCGLVGLKLARGRSSFAPELGEQMLTTDGVLTRTVAETAQVLDVIAGYEPGDATWAPPPPAPFAEAVHHRPRGLRIGLALEPPIDAAVDPVNVAAVQDTARLAESLGHHVEETAPPWRMPELLARFTGVFGPMVAMTIEFAGRVAGRSVAREDVEPLSWEILQGARRVEAPTYLHNLAQLQAMSRAIVAHLLEYDAVLTPALARRPVAIGEIDSCSDDPLDDFRRSGEFTPFTAIANVTGLPAISLPLHHGDDGLPTGVQAIGRPAGEWELLALSAQLEEASPWADRRPALD
jgi:amidase